MYFPWTDGTRCHDPAITHLCVCVYIYIGEGNGKPLQCSLLENPRDGVAWWAAVYGTAQSQTRLKRLSSSSSSTNDWWCSAYIHALLATGTYSLEKCWFESFVLLLLSFILELCSLCILDTSSLPYMYFANTVSCYVRFLIWWCSLKQRKFLI